MYKYKFLGFIKCKMISYQNMNVSLIPKYVSIGLKEAGMVNNFNTI